MGETVGEQPVADVTADRKRDHLVLAAAATSQGGRPAGWEDVLLVPRGLPEVSLHQVDLGTELLGHRLGAPVVLVPMTGGHPDASAVNAALGEVAETFGLAVGVGSQRAALERPDLAPSFAVLRQHAPTAVVLANIGAGQLVDQGDHAALTGADLRSIVDMVGADVLSIHLNAAQELVQPEGDLDTGPLIEGIAAAVESCGVPVLVKQTGSGMTGADATALAAIGVAALDVGGAGGTSFVRIEGSRADRVGDHRAARLGRTLADWGVPTAASVLETVGSGLPVVATGGVRDGLDAARALALGATAAGIGRQAVLAALRGPDALADEVEGLLDELRAVLVLCGVRTPAELALTRPVLRGDTLAWATQRGLW